MTDTGYHTLSRQRKLSTISVVGSALVFESGSLGQCGSGSADLNAKMLQNFSAGKNPNYFRKLLFIYPYPSMKNVQATEEVFSALKENIQ
jgi:hypothetical protein